MWQGLEGGGVNGWNLNWVAGGVVVTVWQGLE